MKKLSAIFLLLVTIVVMPGCQKDCNNCCKPKPTVCIDSSKICPTCPITMEVDPVCGCDGITYGNPSAAKNAGVTSWTKGPCKQNIDTTCIDSSKIGDIYYCYEWYKPVCGCNGITYENECLARKAGVKSWTEGTCNQNQRTYFWHQNQHTYFWHYRKK